MLFIEKLISKASKCLHDIYDLTGKFPKEERNITTNQLKRSAMSVTLNIIEGHRRNSDRYFKNFLNISYSSLFEVKYLIQFSYKRGFISEEDWGKSEADLTELGKMIWSLRSKLNT